jgi:hypothetical protein
MSFRELARRECEAHTVRAVSHWDDCAGQSSPAARTQEPSGGMPFLTPLLQQAMKQATKDHLRPAQWHGEKGAVPEPSAHAPTQSQPGTFSLAS